MTEDNAEELRLLCATVMPSDADPLPEEEDDIADQTPEAEVDDE